MSICVNDMSQWMRSNQLQLNPTKTEVLWCASAPSQQQIPTGPLSMGSTSVVHDLGVHLDADVSIAAHVKQLSEHVLQHSEQTAIQCAVKPLICTLVVSKLNYVNSVLVGMSATLQCRLQSVLNAAT